MKIFDLKSKNSKLAEKWQGPYKVIKVLGQGTLEIKRLDQNEIEKYSSTRCCHQVSRLLNIHFKRLDDTLPTCITSENFPNGPIKYIK